MAVINDLAMKGLRLDELMLTFSTLLVWPTRLSRLLERLQWCQRSPSSVPLRERKYHLQWVMTYAVLVRTKYAQGDLTSCVLRGREPMPMEETQCWVW